MSTREYCGFIVNDRHYTHYQHDGMCPDEMPRYLAKEASAMVKEDPDVWEKAAHRLTKEQTHITTHDRILPRDLLKRVADTHPNKQYMFPQGEDAKKYLPDTHRDVTNKCLPVAGYKDEVLYGDEIFYYVKPSFKELLALPTFSAECDDMFHAEAKDSDIEYMVLADLDNNQFLVLAQGSENPWKPDNSRWDVLLSADLDNHLALAEAANNLSKAEQDDYSGDYVLPGMPTPTPSRRDFSKRMASGAGLRRPPEFPPLEDVIKDRKRIVEAKRKFVYDLKDIYGEDYTEWTPVLDEWENTLREPGPKVWSDRVDSMLQSIEDASEELLESEVLEYLRRAEHKNKIWRLPSVNYEPETVASIKGNSRDMRIIQLKRTRKYSNKEIAAKENVPYNHVCQITKGMPRKIGRR